VFVATVIWNAKHVRPIIQPPVVYLCVCVCVCLSLTFFTFSHKPSILRKTVFYKNCVYICSRLYAGNISHSKKTSVKYYHKLSKVSSRAQEKPTTCSKHSLTPNHHIPHEQASSASTCILIPHHHCHTTT